MERLPYILNIIILMPVCLSLFSTNGLAGVFGGKAVGSDNLRLLIASLWSGVLICSMLALFAPRAFWPLLVFQVIYKSIFLIAFVGPAVAGGQGSTVSWGVAGVFIGIVAIWPFFIAAALRTPS